MAEKRDYYEVLGIPKTATEAEIKKAFRTTAKKYHPDMHPGDKECEEKYFVAMKLYETTPESLKSISRRLPPRTRNPAVEVIPVKRVTDLFNLV